MRQMSQPTTGRSLANELAERVPAKAAARLCVGIDLVEITQISNSLARFGQRFMSRLFTPAELAYASASPPLMAERLAARFAAKEAALKAFDMAESGIDWRDIEVVKREDGSCTLALHRKAARVAHEIGVSDIGLSLSHDGLYAAAVVTALPALPPHL